LSWDQLLDVAIKAARRAGELQLRYFQKGFKVEYKGEINLVTEVDKLCEQEIVEYIRSHYPDHGVLTEEGLFEGVSHTDVPCLWIIDPLDGTTNYAHGYPVFSVSIALQVRGELVLGVVFDPTRDELFWGFKGKGSYLNGERLRVSRTSRLSKGLLATGFPYDLKEDPVNNLDHFNRMIMKAQAIRRGGSAALDLCYVAAGRLDGFWELKLSPWDIAAGILIVREAFGRVTDFDGHPIGPYSREVVASNGLIHEEMLEVLRYGKRPTT